MKRLGGILVCKNYQSNHPSIKGKVQSVFCRGCLNRKPIDSTIDAFVIDKDPDNINCINFRGVKEEK